MSLPNYENFRPLGTFHSKRIVYLNMTSGHAAKCWMLFNTLPHKSISRKEAKWNQYKSMKKSIFIVQNSHIHFLLAGYSNAYFCHSHGLFDKRVEHLLLETCPLNSWMSVSQPVAARTSQWPRRTNYHPLPAESLQRKSEAPERWARR